MIKNKEWFKERIRFEQMELAYAKNKYYPEEKIMTSESIFYLIDQLEEPEKVVIPMFVAEWIELCKEMAYLSDCLESRFEYGIDNSKTEIFKDENDWLLEKNNITLVARAWLDGYTIEPEKRYRLKCKNGLFKTTYAMKSYETWIPYTNEDYEGEDREQVAFTESELSQMDETGFERIEVKK